MSAAVHPSPKKEKVRYYPGPSYFVRRMTYDEYSAIEEDAQERHELIDGKVFTMPGASLYHNRILSNTLRILADAIESVEIFGEVLGEGQKVYISDKISLYPDVTVVLGEAQTDAKQALLNPAVAVEILSPSTEGYDRGLKFEKYQTIPSLRHYLIIEQERVSVTHFEKIAGNLWAIIGIHNSRTETLTVTLGEAKISVPLTAIYRRVEAPEGDVDIAPNESEEEA